MNDGSPRCPPIQPQATVCHQQFFSLELLKIGRFGFFNCPDEFIGKELKYKQRYEMGKGSFAIPIISFSSAGQECI